jgi:hypothetical protein
MGRYCDVDMDSGKCERPIFDALQGFWPGLLAQLGDVGGAARSLNAFLAVQRALDSPAPEETDWLRWTLPTGDHI